MTTVLTPTRCSECKVEWPEEPERPSFSHQVGGCRECKREYHRRWNAQPHEVQKRLDHYAKNGEAMRKAAMDRYWRLHNTDQDPHLLRSLKERGLSLDEYRKMLAEQEGLCAICGEEENGRFRRLAIDHNHDTGVVRGLLCGRCNKGLGLFKDNVDALFSAIEYLTTERV